MAMPMIVKLRLCFQTRHCLFKRIVRVRGSGFSGCQAGRAERGRHSRHTSPATPISGAGLQCGNDGSFGDENGALRWPVDDDLVALAKPFLTGVLDVHLDRLAGGLHEIGARIAGENPP